MLVGKCFCHERPRRCARGEVLQQAECSKQFRDGGSFQQLIEAGFGCACDEN